MEVILKKTKITSTLINQIEHFYPCELNYKNVLGFVIHSKKKYIILYDSKINRLCKLYYNTELEELKDFNSYFLVTLSSYTKFIRFDNKELAEYFIKSINLCKAEAIVKGQIFY
jgi:hypothetical protein